MKKITADQILDRLAQLESEHRELILRIKKQLYKDVTAGKLTEKEFWDLMAELREMEN